MTLEASTFGAAFDKLPVETRCEIIRQLTIRKHRYIQALMRGYSTSTRAVIIGDTPGPGRPTNPRYHNTPFYSTKNSSLWLNRQLVEAGIDESKLLWFNAMLANGTDLPGHHIADLFDLKPVPWFFVLGGKAEMWMRRVAPTTAYTKVFHPQYVKRFRAGEPYELIKLLKIV